MTNTRVPTEPCVFFSTPYSFSVGMMHTGVADVEHVKLNPIADRPRPRASVMTLLTRMDDRTSRMASTLVIGLVVAVALLGTLFGLMVAGLEYSKETHVSHGQLVSANGGEPLTAAPTPTRSDVGDLAEYALAPLEEVAHRVSLDDKLILAEETGKVSVLHIYGATVEETEDDLIITYIFANENDDNLSLSMRSLVESDETHAGRALLSLGQRSNVVVGTLLSSAYPNCKAIHGDGWCYNAFTGKCKTPCARVRTWPDAHDADNQGVNKEECPSGYYWNYRMKKCWPRLVVDEKRPPVDN